MLKIKMTTLIRAILLISFFVFVGCDKSRATFVNPNIDDTGFIVLSTQQLQAETQEAKLEINTQQLETSIAKDLNSTEDKDKIKQSKSEKTENLETSEEVPETNDPQAPSQPIDFNVSLPILGQVCDVPTMILKYTINDTAYETAVLPGSYTWQTEFCDGTIIHRQACGLHPLDPKTYLPEINRNSDTIVLDISFSFPHSSISAQRWIDDYIGKFQEYAYDFEDVPISRNTIVLAGSDESYVYEVNARWSQGDADYAFYIK